jgi:peroxiredoxin Q/BCP
VTTGRFGVGDKAPDFTLQDQDGRKVSLHDFAGSKNVVLYFYPKDFTPGCTAETKSFSSVYGQIRGMGAEVLGISTATIGTHKEFATSCGAGFPLLADEEGGVRKLYDVQPSMWMIPGRTTFVIDKQGIIRHVFSSQTNTAGHVAEALKALKTLTS